MKLKTIEVEGNTYAEIDAAGLPVYVDDGGKETGLNAPDLSSHVGRLNRENGNFRKERDDAREKLQTFGDIDPVAARAALENKGSLEEAIKKARGEVAAELTTKHEKEVGGLKGLLNQEMIGNRFGHSEFIREKVATPVPMLQSTFGKRFVIEDGQVVGKDVSGNTIWSKSNAAQPADFDEAMEAMIEQSGMGDHILKVEIT